MFRALVWKEWRQLGLVRWGGIALGAVLPLAFVAGAQLASHGLLPTGTVTEYSSRDLMYELLPAGFALGLWPLIGLLVASQAFGGDRSAGTENFLLERPVPRGAIWRARLTASLSSLLLVLVSTAAVGVVFARLSGPPPGIGWTRWLILGGLGLGLGLLAWIGAMLAATLLPSPLGAVLLGGVVGGVPALLAAQMTTVFPHARYGDLRLGMVLPWVLVPAYVAASFLAASRGEPAGRGRVRRGVGIAIGALAAVILVFVAGAPITVRANARTGMHEVRAPRQGGSAFVGRTWSSGDGRGGGWLVDTKTGRSLRFMAPVIGNAVWNRDGSRIAVWSGAGPLGSDRADPQLEIFGASGDLVKRAVAMRSFLVGNGMTWSGEDLVSLAYGEDDHRGRMDVVVLRSGDTTWKPLGFEQPVGALRVMGALGDGRLALLDIELGERSKSGYSAYRGSKIFVVDVKHERVEGPILELPPSEVANEGALSPDGRFLIGSERVEEGSTPNITHRRHFVREVATGQDVPGLVPWERAQWLAGDRVAWLDGGSQDCVLVVASIDGRSKTVREWKGADVGFMVSPDGHALFISVLPTFPNSSSVPTTTGGAIHDSPSASRSGVFEELVYFVDEDRMISLGPPFSDRKNDQKYTLWAGPKTLARIAAGVVAFEDLDAPGKRRFVLGSESDLR
jgi:hypothetical protein